jgi:hypothetical protein
MKTKQKSILIKESLHSRMDVLRGKLGLRTFTELIEYLMAEHLTKNKN